MPANFPAAPAPVPAEAVAPPASDWWRPGARARVPAPAAWSPTAECPVCAEPPSKTPPRPAAVTLAARDAKVKPPPRPRGRARSRPRRATTQLMSQASASPASNPDFQAATGQIRVEALRQRTHPLALRKRTEVEKSAKLDVKVQEDQSAKDRNAIKMGKVGAEQLGASRNFSAAGFKAELKKRVESKPPKSEDDAKKLAKSDAVQHFEQDFSKGLATEQGKVTGPLNQQASGDPKKAGFEAGVQAVPIPKPVYPPPPGPVDPSLVVPKPKPDPEVSLQQESDRLSGAMQHNRLSDDQLEQSREPSFLKTLKAKQDAQQKIGEARIEYRRQEAATLQGATAQANQSLSTSLTGISRTHTRVGGRVAGGQKDTESKTQKRQREIKQTIDEIYERTAGCVKCTLESLTKKVTADFTRILKEETDTFNSRVRDRLDSYYSTGKKVKHFLLGEPKVVVEKTDGSVRVRDLRRDDWDMSSFPPRIKTPWINPQVYKIFLEEKDLFIAKMDVQLDAIVKDVQTGLTTANNQIQAGKDAVTSFIRTLGDDELRFAKDLEQDVLMKFENLEGTIDDAREDLLATLADQYRESVNQLETTFNEINDELKKTWLDRAVEFIETVGKTIFQLAELLFSILKRIAYLVWDIIKHPIRFFETLVTGLKQGISDFIDDIGTHLKEAFWTWLTDATPGKNIRLSLGSGVAGLFDLVMQVLNLGRPELRAIVDKVLGPEFMQMVDKGEAFAEKAFEPVIILFTKGPVAFWDYIKEQLEEIIQSSFDRIKESVFLAFVKKGILWIAGFFVPGGGFVKIVKAIVRAFQFVAENLDRIRLFFDSVFDSMEAATQGNPAGVASKILAGLKMGIVLALGFLARQLGLDAIIASVHKILHALRRPIVNAIEWLLRRVKPLVDKIVATVKKVGTAVVQAGVPKDPNERLRVGGRVALAVVNRFAGRRIASAVLNPLLGSIRIRYGFRTLRVVPTGRLWSVEAIINPRWMEPSEVFQEWVGATDEPIYGPPGPPQPLIAILTASPFPYNYTSPQGRRSVDAIIDNINAAGTIGLRYVEILRSGQLSDIPGFSDLISQLQNAELIRTAYPVVLEALHYIESGLTNLRFEDRDPERESDVDLAVFNPRGGYSVVIQVKRPTPVPLTTTDTMAAVRNATGNIQRAMAQLRNVAATRKIIILYLAGITSENYSITLDRAISDQVSGTRYEVDIVLIDDGGRRRRYP